MELINYINTSIDILCTLKVDEIMEKYKRKKNENIAEEYEDLLVKEEATIRKHLAVGNRLKLENESLKAKIKIIEEEQKKYEENINKIKEENEIIIKKLNKEIIILKNEMQKNEIKFMKKLGNKQKEIHKLQMDLNNLTKNIIKSKEESKDNQVLIEKKFKKNNSMDFGIKFRVNYSDLNLLQKNMKINNSMRHSNSVHNIYKLNNKLDFKKLSNERNNLINNALNKSVKNKTSFKNENIFFNGFIGNNKNYNSQLINENCSSIRKIKKRFKFIYYKKHNSFSDIKLENEEINSKEIKVNKKLLLQRNDNNLKRTFSAINKRKWKDICCDLFQNLNNNNLNNDQIKDNIYLKNEAQKEKTDKNSTTNINKKKEIKIINKFRISSINKDENKNNFSYKKEDENNSIFPKKILENKILGRVQNKRIIDKYKGISINYNIPTN